MSDLVGRNPGKRGVTLVELLVVIGILTLLATIAIPSMQMLTADRRIREAARAVNVFFGSARNRAIETGRPHGVMFQRLDLQPQASVVLRQAEVPPPYAGNGLGAVVLPVPPPVPSAGYVKVMVPPGQLSPGLVRWGDLIQLNYQGPLYTIVDDPSDNNPPSNPTGADFPIDPAGFINFDAATDADGNGWIDGYWLTLALDPHACYIVPWPTGMPVPFQIYRQPVASAGAPLRLTARAVVDLDASGTDSLLPAVFGLESPADRRPVVVMFAANGAVDRVYFYHPTAGYGGYPVSEPICLLVGKSERLLQPEDGLDNFQDATNLWVAINPQTGLVTVAEVHADLLDPGTNTYIPSGATAADQVLNSRRLAREAQISKGGR